MNETEGRESRTTQVSFGLSLCDLGYPLRVGRAEHSCQRGREHPRARLYVGTAPLTRETCDRGAMSGRPHGISGDRKDGRDQPPLLSHKDSGNPTLNHRRPPTSKVVWYIQRGSGGTGGQHRFPENKSCTVHTSLSPRGPQSLEVGWNAINLDLRR